MAIALILTVRTRLHWMTILSCHIYILSFCWGFRMSVLIFYDDKCQNPQTKSSIWINQAILIKWNMESQENADIADRHIICTPTNCLSYACKKLYYMHVKHNTPNRQKIILLICTFKRSVRECFWKSKWRHGLKQNILLDKNSIFFNTFWLLDF